MICNSSKLFFLRLCRIGSLRPLLLAFALLAVVWGAGNLVACQQDEDYQFTVSDDYLAANMSGYRRIKIRIDRTGVTKLCPNDQHFSIVASVPISWRSGAVKIVKDVVMKRGDTSLQTEIYLPYLASNGNASIFVDLNRSGQRDYRREASHELPSNYYRTSTSPVNCPRILFVHDKPQASSAENPRDVTVMPGMTFPTTGTSNLQPNVKMEQPPPAIRPLVKLFGQSESGGYESNYNSTSEMAEAIQRINSTFVNWRSLKDGGQWIDLYDYLHAATWSNFPKRPEGLFSYEVLVADYSDLRQAIQDYPEQIAALRDWLSLGGTLFVLDAPSERAAWNQSASDLTLLGPQSPARNWRTVELDADIWFESFHRRFLNDGSKVFAEEFRSQMAERRLASREVALAETPSNKSCWYANFQLGRIVFSTTSGAKMEMADWARLFANAYIDGRKMGVAQALGDSSLIFEETPGLQIPGAGQPPRLAISGLITLYALLMGPGIFWLLSRRQQLPLFAVLVPLLSTLTTLLLIVFVLWKDGLSIRGVVWHAACVDNRSGHLMSQTSTAVFAGWSIGKYRFEPHEVPFFTIHSELKNDLVLDQTSDEWQMYGGMNRPRINHQVHVLRTGQTQQRLDIQRVASGAETAGSNEASTAAWKFTNQFETPISAGFVATADGLFWIDSLQPGQSTSGTPIKVDEITSKWPIEKFRDYLPSEVQDRLLNYRRRAAAPYYYNYNNGQSLKTESESKILSTGFFESLKSRKDWSDSLWIQPGNYVVICDESTLLKPLHPQMRVQFQQHVIFGRW